MPYDEKTDTVSFENVKATGATGKGVWCLSLDGDWEGTIFFPQSQIHDDSEVYRKDDEGTLVVQRWLAEKKGLV